MNLQNYISNMNWLIKSWSLEGIVFLMLIVAYEYAELYIKQELVDEKLKV